MLSNITIYKENYEPNKIYYDKHSTHFVLMVLDDGSYVVGKGTNMPVDFSSNVGKADAEVEPLRRNFLNEVNKFEESLRFENFMDLQRFIWGREEYIRNEAVLLDFPNKIYVGSNKWGIQFCVVNTDVEVSDGYIYLKHLGYIYNKDLIKIPIIDDWVGFRMSLEEFNAYREYDGEFTYSAEADSKKAIIADAVTILSNIFSDTNLQRLLQVHEKDIDELIQGCRENLFKDLGCGIINGKVELSYLSEEGFIADYCRKNMTYNLDLQQLVMLYGIKKYLNKIGD